MKNFYTLSDIHKIHMKNSDTLFIGPDDQLTDLAKYEAKKLGIKIVKENTNQSTVVSHHINKHSKESQDRPKDIFTSNDLNIKEDNNSENIDEYDLVIQNGVCIIPEIGSLNINVGIKNGKIASLTNTEIQGRKNIDASGMFVLPGIIDPHTHLGLFAPLKDELVSETRSALLGGVTTIGTYFNIEGSYLPFIESLVPEVNSLSRIDIIPHLAIRSLEQLEELPIYSKMGFNSYKVYMCGVPGVYPNQDDGFIVEVMQAMNELPPWANPLLSIHCENQDICDRFTQKWENKELTSLHDWNETHPNLAEAEAVERAAFLSKELNARTYIVHTSTKEAVSVLKTLKHDKLFVETTSPYLCLDIESDIGVYGKMLPPIREKLSREALWKAIRSNIIDTIGTDNTVLTSSEKNVKQGMKKAIPGYPTLSTHLASVLTEGVYKQELSLEKIIPLMTMNPAKIFGVYPRKGTIMPGSDADIVIIKMDCEWIVDPQKLQSRSDFSLFQNKKMRVSPIATIKNGQLVALDGKIIDEDHRGSILKH